MKANIGLTAIGGIAATMVMAIIGYLAPLMGLPKMSAPEMLSGIVFSFAYGWFLSVGCIKFVAKLGKD